MAAASTFAGVPLAPVSHLEGGDEATVLHLRAADRDVVLHVSPPWRSREELLWVHRLTRAAAQEVPAVVAPLDREGGTVFEHAGRVAALYPWVEGSFLDRDDPAHRTAAAVLLAQVHRALAGHDPGPRPRSGADHPAPPPDPPGLLDPELDAWCAKRAPGLRTGPTHGDFYRRNLLWRDGRIAGLIDWHEAAVRPLVWELAGATFELCRDDAHHLRTERARSFVGAYLEAGGPVPPGEVADLGPVMRQWVRDDARGSLALAANGDSDARAYAALQVGAFRALAGTRLSLGG